MKNPLVLLQLVKAAVRVVRKPERLDEVIGIADRLGQMASFQPIVDHLAASPEGAAALVDRPRVAIDLPALRALPAGTFGREAARFLDARGLDPADLPHREAADGPSWLRAHLFESHDLWHVVTGFDTDVAGEAGLQAFYLAQIPSRLATVLLSLIFLNTTIYAFDDRARRVDAIVRGWQLGRAARPLLGVRWAELWAVPLVEVQARLGLDGGARAAEPATLASPVAAASARRPVAPS